MRNSRIVLMSVLILLLTLAAGCSAAVQTPGQGNQQFVWVCHGNRNPRWQRVAAPAADAHRRHGDRVSSRQQEEGGACDNTERS